MNTKTASLLTGTLMMLSGIFVALISYVPSPIIKYVITISSLIGGASALLVAIKGQGRVIPVAYSWLIGLGGIAYGLAVAFFTTSLNGFLETTGFSLLVLGFLEIAFACQVLNFERQPVVSITLYRIFTGLSTGIGAMGILIASSVDKNVALLFAGIILSLAGLSFTLISSHKVREEVALGDTEFQLTGPGFRE